MEQSPTAAERLQLYKEARIIANFSHIGLCYSIGQASGHRYYLCATNDRPGKDMLLFPELMTLKPPHREWKEYWFAFSNQRDTAIGEVIEKMEKELIKK